NDGNGVEVGGNAHGILIGGIPPDRHLLGTNNVISSNDGYGVAFTGTAHDNQVNLTFIGTDVKGNVKGGILMGSGTYANTLGSTDSILPTIISGNHGAGIEMNGTQGNTVVGTQIGVGVDTRQLPNDGNGILIVNSYANVIGGTAKGAGNTIAFNHGNGVLVKSGTGNTIRGNSIHDNSPLGIRLAPGAN